MRFEVAHDLDMEDARRMARKAVDEYVSRYAHYRAAVQWRDADHATLSLHARGVSLQGTLSLRPSSLVLEVEVPLLLRPFVSKAKQIIEQHVQQWVDRAHRGLD